MKVEKRLLLRIFFSLEVVIFSLIYFVGSHGVYSVMQLQHENTAIEMSIAHLAQEIKMAEQEIVHWKKNYDYFVEKEAREKLQLAHEHDWIFYP